MTDVEKQKILKYLEEFELVNPVTGDIYVEKDVYIELIIGKTGKYEYNVFNNEKEEIGRCLDKKSIILSSKYKERKQKEIDGKEFDFDADLEIDLDKMIERQQEKEELERVRLENETLEREANEQREKDNKEKDIMNNNDIEENNKEAKQQELEKDEKQKNEEQNKGEPISQKELNEQGYNISSFSLIKDENIIKAMVVDNFDPRTVIVAEDKGKIKFLAREVGTGEIKELPQIATSASGEHVNEFNNGVERESVATNKVALANCPGIEFSIDKNKVGQLELYYVDNIDKEGNREAIPVKTQAIHPTKDEYERSVLAEKLKKYGGYDVKNVNEIDDREEEIKARLADEKDSIRDEVYEEIDDMEELPDNEELEEMIEKEYDEEQEELGEEKEKKIEENEGFGPWTGHDEHDFYKRN